MKIKNVRHLVNELSDKETDRYSPSFNTVDAAIKKAAKRGVAVGGDGRCYTPESKRGVGVGYGKHG